VLLINLALVLSYDDNNDEIKLCLQIARGVRYYENILNDLMPDDLRSMHLSGKLVQMIDNKNKTMIVEMKAPSVIIQRPLTAIATRGLELSL
jgi:hypothetical protein